MSFDEQWQGTCEERYIDPELDEPITCGAKIGFSEDDGRAWHVPFVVTQDNIPGGGKIITICTNCYRTHEEAQSAFEAGLYGDWYRLRLWTALDG